MRSLVLALFILTGITALAGCDKSTPSSPQKSGEGHTPDDGHDHGGKTGGDAHKGHDHEGHDHGGQSFTLGVVSIQGFKVKAVQEGDLVAGKDASFDVTFSGGTGKPSGVRGWIGAENAADASKAKGEVEGSGFHVHVAIPNPFPADAKFWVEVEAAAGKATGSFALKR